MYGNGIDTLCGNVFSLINCLRHEACHYIHVGWNYAVTIFLSKGVCQQNVPPYSFIISTEIITGSYNLFYKSGQKPATACFYLNMDFSIKFRKLKLCVLSPFTFKDFIKNDPRQTGGFFKFHWPLKISFKK